MPEKKAAQKCILVVLAHPDDETFGMGGTLAYYAAQGVAVHLVCATKGEAGLVEEHYLENYKSIADLRQAELACAAEALGLASVNYLGYRDSGMAGTKENGYKNALMNAPLDEVAEKVVKYIRKLKPQVVITFDPVGGYHHPDHIAIHKATMRAFEQASKAKAFPKAGKPFAPNKLYYSARSRRGLRWIVRFMKLTGRNPSKVGRNKDIDLTVLARDPDTPPHVSVHYKSAEEQRVQAVACHASQLGGFPRLSVMELYYRLVGRKDSFTRAYPPAADNFRARDLFA